MSHLLQSHKWVARRGSHFNEDTGDDATYTKVRSPSKQDTVHQLVNRILDHKFIVPQTKETSAELKRQQYDEKFAVSCLTIARLQNFFDG